MRVYSLNIFRLKSAKTGDNSMIDNRLKEMSEKTGKTIDELEKDFSNFVKDSFSDAWKDAQQNLSKIEDEDFFFFLEAYEIREIRKRGSGSSGKGEEYVGMIVGLKGSRDIMANQRRLAQESAEIDLASTLKYGITPFANKQITVHVGRAHYGEGHWMISNGQDQVVHREEGKENDLPRWAIAVPGKAYYIALLGGKGPKVAYSMKKEYYVVANTPQLFLKDGPLPMTVLECNFDAAEVELKMNVPIKFRAEKDTSYLFPNETILVANQLYPEYGLGWVEDKHLSVAEQMFSPDQYLSQFLPYVSDLSVLHDFHDSNQKNSSKTGKDYGPTVCIKGVVDYIDHDGKENAYADGGFVHNMTVSSQSLRRENSDAKLWIKVSADLKNNHHAFKGQKDGSWTDFTSGTQVFIVVTTSTWENQMGEINLNLDAHNVWAVPKRIFWAETPSDESNDLSGLGGFRGDGQ